MNGVNVMVFKIKNFGKINEANIKLDGITVICGDNNSGKSTVGKALFSFFNSLYDLNNKISENKLNKIRSFLYSQAFSFTGHSGYSFRNDDSFSDFIVREKISAKELKKYIDDHILLPGHVKLTQDSLAPLVEALNAPISEVINELVLRNFDSVMNGQIKNDNSTGKCSINAIFKDENSRKSNSNEIVFYKSGCKCDNLNVLIQHTAYYINSPFVLDWLNNPERVNIMRFMNLMDRSTIDAIVKAQADINADSMSNILESVTNRADMKIVEDVLNHAYRGNTKISNGKYFYTDENGKDFDFRNISAGLKSFALIERMLKTGVLKRKDVLILDEPEIHLHSEWQIIYAELIVILQKTFDLRILLVTHSFQFLESLNFFMKKHGIFDKGNYYMPASTEKGIVMQSFGNDPDELKRNLSTGTFRIVDLEYEFDMEQENGTN